MKIGLLVMQCVFTYILYQPKTVLSVAEIMDPVWHVDTLKHGIYFVDTVLGLLVWSKFEHQYSSEKGLNFFL